MSSTEDPSSNNPSEDYASRPGQKDKDEIPVAKDENVEEGGYEDAETADSDAQLGTLIYIPRHSQCRCKGILTSSTEKDDKDAIDKDNIVEGKTRGAAKGKGGYREPGDDEGIPTDD